jgi:hypothetical protein
MDLSVYDYAAGPKAHKRAYVLSESHYVYTRQFRLGEYIRLWHPGHCNWTSVRRDQSENVPATKRRQGPFCSAPSRNPLQKPSPKTRSTLSFAESHRMYGTLFVIHKSRDGFDGVSWQPKLQYSENTTYNTIATPLLGDAPSEWPKLWPALVIAWNLEASATQKSKTHTDTYYYDQ